mmetsp:Transcript_5120/g.7216  ORF Transcript_5120/g.7216 Transcript_5120/m.7216 type:complete len:938 (+) Transcript_5120:3-2816(+)
MMEEINLALLASVHSACLNGEYTQLVSLFNTILPRKASVVSPTDEKERTSKSILSYLCSQDAHGRNCFHYVCASTNVLATDTLKYLFDLLKSCGIENTEKKVLTAQDKHGMTPLHIACASPVTNAKTVEQLIQSCSESLHFTDNNGEICLHSAGKTGSSETVVLLIKSGATTNKRNNKGETPLHVASLYGNSQAVKALLENGLDPLEESEPGLTGVHLAAFSGNFECLETILAKVPENSSKLRNLLHYAASGGSVQAIELVLKRMDIKVDSCDDEKVTPLHLAGVHGHRDCLQYLLSLGADILAEDIYHETPLVKAAASGQVPCLEFLIEKTPQYIRQQQLNKALHWGCFYGQVRCVSLLLSCGASLFSKDADGTIPLHKAAFGGHKACIKLLLEKATLSNPDNFGELINARDNQGATPLHKAAWSGNKESLIALLQCPGIEVDARDNEDGTPLLNACYHNATVDAVIALLEHGASINGVDKAGVGPFHVLAAEGHLDVLRFLAEHGNEISQEDSLVDINQRTKDGYTPLLCALHRNHKQTAYYLVDSAAALIPGVDYDTNKPLSQIAAQFEIDLKHLEELANFREEKKRQAKGNEMDEEQKKVWKNAAQIFNNSPKKGIAYFVSENLIQNTPQDIAKLLFSYEELSKKQIGDYLGEEQQAAVLSAYVELMSFQSLEFDVALRKFLIHFRLPGEAQKIDRIMEKFAQQYFNANPSTTVFANSDSVYLLAFATIMLNTDAHSVNIKKKMTKAEFLNNTRSNNGSFPKEFLEDLYDRIVNDEIKMETEGKAWSSADKKGWLTKQGGNIKTWKKRWFILNHNCLYYFKTPSDVEPVGIIPLENLQCIKTETKKKHCLMIFDPSGASVKSAQIKKDGSIERGNHQAFYVSAATTEELESWFKAINTNIHQSPFYDLLKNKQQPKKVVNEGRARSRSVSQQT